MKGFVHQEDIATLGVSAPKKTRCHLRGPEAGGLKQESESLTPSSQQQMENQQGYKGSKWHIIQQQQNSYIFKHL